MDPITDKKYYSYHITQRFLRAMDRILGNRINGKVTAAAFADNVGMTSSNINRLRSSTGENIVTVEAIGRVCEVYKISPYWLITGKGEMYTNAELFAAYESLEARVHDIENALVDIDATLRLIKNNSPKNSKIAVNKFVNKIPDQKAKTTKSKK